MDTVLDSLAVAAASNGAAAHHERTFLQGPNTRTHELRQIIRVAWGMLRGFRVLHFVGPYVTVFGSARFTEDHPCYGVARKIGSQLGDLGFTVTTGGGPGLMEAANRGLETLARVRWAATSPFPRNNSPTHISIEEAMAHIRAHAIEKFGLRAARAPRRRWWLFEKPEIFTAIRS